MGWMDWLGVAWIVVAVVCYVVVWAMCAVAQRADDRAHEMEVRRRGDA